MMDNPQNKQSAEAPQLIPPHGGFRDLQSYQMAEIPANTMICLIHQTSYLLDQQLRALEKEFLKEGGFTQRMYRARSRARSWSKNK